MPQTLHAWAMVLARVLAGGVGFLAFYIAVFLFENEEGKLQNRIDGFWDSVDDRAQDVDSRNIALFNKLSSLIRFTLSRAFGAKLVSLQAIFASATVSVSTAAFLYFELGTGFSPQKVLAARLFGVLFLACLILPFIFPRRTVRILCFIPPLYLIVFVIATVVMVLIRVRTFWVPQIYTSLAWLLALAISVPSDFFAVFFVRRQLVKIEAASSIFRLFVATAALVNAVLLVAGLPYVIYIVTPHPLNDYRILSAHTLFNLTVMSLSSSVLLLNVCTAAYAIIPALVLLFLAIHRIFWPALRRFLYPLKRYKIATRKGFLVVVGSTCLAFAFNLEKLEVLKDMLKEMF